MSKKNCPNCKFSKSIDMAGVVHDISAPKQLMCQRNPPVAMLVPAPEGVGFQFIQPVVTETGYCGEFSSKLEVN